MKPLSWLPMTITAGAGLAAGALLTGVLLKLAYAPPVITPWLAVLFALIAAAVLWAGIGVRRFKRRESTRITALDAARIALFARSAALNGAMFSGALAGILIVSLFRAWAPATATAALHSGIALVAALAMAIISWLVESWCVDDSGDADHQDSGSTRDLKDPNSPASARNLPKNLREKGSSWQEG